MDDPQVIVAGFNVDSDSLLELAAQRHPDRPLTPETVAAAYARISRDPRPVHELRAQASRELAEARKSNRTIVFDMGHSSIAEHAVFNIDIINVSRLLAEHIEAHRLVSYTEKSQRYVLLDGDFVTPEELTDKATVTRFGQIITRQNDFYRELYPKLREQVFRSHPTEAEQPKFRNVLEGLAKEDARYILALATKTQLGMTINARNLALLMRRLNSGATREGRVLSGKIHDQTVQIAPSLIRYTKETDYDLALSARRPVLSGEDSRTGADQEAASCLHIVNLTADGDDQILAALWHSRGGLSMKECQARVRGMSLAEKTSSFRSFLQHMKPYDTAPREFEYAGLCLEAVVSASCFAQLKRHRPLTLTCQEYDPALGVTIPPAITQAGMEEPFRRVIAATEELYQELRATAPAAAPYLLTNAHRRRVLINLNLRELYHLARIRTDRHAQWDISSLVKEMVNEAKAAFPLAMMLACGKDDFDRLYEEVYQ